MIASDASCKRTETILSAPADTLKSISISPQDIQVLRDIESFILRTENISSYDFRYLGKELLKGSDCYVFEVVPKKDAGSNSFTGQIWVEDTDLHILKLYGKLARDSRANNSENLFPRMEITRELVDGTYWFPATATSTDTLSFSSGPQKIRQLVQYDNYKK